MSFVYQRSNSDVSVPHLSFSYKFVHVTSWIRTRVIQFDSAEFQAITTTD